MGQAPEGRRAIFAAGNNHGVKIDLVQKSELVFFLTTLPTVELKKGIFSKAPIQVI
jgi:hypothetical protein